MINKIFIYIFLSLFFMQTAFACSGDCASCHFNVNFNDKYHQIMNNCKICHTDEKLAKLSMQSSCGQDCFACHSVEKINMVKNKEHEALITCIDCHVSLKNTLREKLNNNIKPLFDNEIFHKK